MNLEALSPVSRVEIDTDALEHNYHCLVETVGPATEVAAVVKGDAYGHGLLTAARAFYRAGCRTFCIAEVEEAYPLRKEFGTEVRLIRVVPSLPGEFEATTSFEIEETIASLDQILRWKEWLEPRERRLKVHFKIDRGMGRLGFAFEDHREGWTKVRNSRCFDLAGIMSHLPASEEEPEVSSNVEEHLGYHTYREVERFQNLALALEAEHGKPLTKHLANSGGALFYPESRFDLVRAGLSLYGADPRGEAGSLRGLRPAMAVSTHLVQVRKFPVGATIGYGREYRVTEPMRVGVLPLGYSDGFFRSAAGKAEVLIQGRRCPLLGRVSMNLISVDLSNVFEPELGEKVTIIGEDGGDRILVEDLARWSGTIPYEILTSMGRLAPRLTP